MDTTFGISMLVYGIIAVSNPDIKYKFKYGFFSNIKISLLSLFISLVESRE